MYFFDSEINTVYGWVIKNLEREQIIWAIHRQQWHKLGYYDKYSPATQAQIIPFQHTQ